MERCSTESVPKRRGVRPIMSYPEQLRGRMAWYGCALIYRGYTLVHSGTVSV